MHRGAIAPYWTITHWIGHGRASCLPPDIGIATRTLPQAAPSPGRTPPVRPQDNPGTRTPGLRPASPGLARPRPGSPALARPRPASPGLVDARPACPRHWHRDPRTPSRWTSARLHAARLAPMYPGMADARTPPLKICTTSLTWSPILYVPAPHAPPETQALLPSRSTGADGRPVLGPDLGQVALPPGPPGQTGARSWAPTWARSPCPPVHRGRPAPGPGPLPGPGRLAPRSTGADRRPVLGPYLGQVALPPGTPGQTGARSWAPTWARSPCPPVHRGRRAPGPGPRPGPGRLAPRSTGADGRPVLGPDLGQVALPPGPPGQTGARSLATTWARALAPRSTGADGRPVLSHDLGQGEVWGPGGGRPAERWRGLMPEHRVEAFSHLCCRLVWHAADRCPGITVTTVLTFFGNVPSGGADWSPRRYLYNGSFLKMHEI